MDAGRVREGVRADDGLVGLDQNAGHGGDHARGLVNLLGANISLQAVGVPARVQGHDDFFQRRVAGAFADAVDGAFDLPRARAGGGEGVGRRHAEVVVAVGGQRDVLGAGDVVQDARKQRPVLLRGHIARGVGDVDDGRAGLG